MRVKLKKFLFFMRCKKRNIKNVLKRGLIVSCQALENEPLHSPFIMSKMALAAKQGGAIGIRANSPNDIKAIKREVNLPVIGIIKKDYKGYDVYITPTMGEVKKLAGSGAEIIAVDATLRERPGDLGLEEMTITIRQKYPSLYIMADISNYEEGMNAAKLGFDLIATTLSGYTKYTLSEKLPNISLIKRLSKSTDIPIIAEGGIWTVEDAKKAYNSGAWSIVIGSAITRPQLITKRFTKALA